MAININSQEFANAWRIVSEALLQAIQGGLQFPVVSDTCGNGGQSPVTPPAPPVRPQADPVAEPRPQPPREGRTKIDERYAACPTPQADGTYTLKNLKDERQEGSTFKITRYSDGTCDIELCNLKGEALQVFKDTKSEKMPQAVGNVFGEIAPDKRIVNTKPGKGVMDGRSVRIIEPLEVEFQ